MDILLRPKRRSKGSRRKLRADLRNTLGDTRDAPPSLNQLALAQRYLNYLIRETSGDTYYNGSELLQAVAWGGPTEWMEEE